MSSDDDFAPYSLYWPTVNRRRSVFIIQENMARYDRRTPEKVVLEKTGPHVEVTAGPYTKRQLREMLLSSLSLLDGSSDREVELMRLSGVDPEDVRKIKDGEVLGADDEELLEETSKNIAALRFLKLIANDAKSRADPENDLAILLRNKGISDDLINRILTFGLTDETVRLLKALGLTDEEIAELFGVWKRLEGERSNESEGSCPSVPASSDYMTVDGFYLMNHFRKPLTKALSDLVSKKPWNPAEYLGHWLLNYKICEERAQRQKEFDAGLQAEREKRRIKVTVEPNVSEVDDDDDEELPEDWDLIEYEAVS